MSLAIPKHGAPALAAVLTLVASSRPCRTQTTLSQFAPMSKADLPRLAVAADHVLADFDRDGDLDVFAVSAGSQPGNQLLENLGKGSFRLHALQGPADSYTCVATGDVDGDGNLDLVTGGDVPNTFYQGSTRLFLGRGNRQFDRTAGRLPADTELTRDLALGDVDGDGDLDLVLGQAPVQASPGRARLYLNDGKGFFTDVTATAMPGNNDETYSIALGDVDGDRDLDLVLGNGSLSQVKVGNKLYLNDGRGRFSDATQGRLSATKDWTMAVLLADLDADGDLDLVEGNFGQSRLLVNDGRGTFGPPAVSLPIGNLRTRSIATGDLDRDGDLDLYLGNSGDQDQLYLNDGNGAFGSASGGLPYASGDGTGTSIADLDGDGDLDVFALSYNGWPGSEVLLQVGSLRFVSGLEVLGPAMVGWGNDVAVGDLDGDGNVDLVSPTPTLSRRAWLCLGGGDGRFKDVTATHAPPIAIWSGCVAMADVDGDGDLDLALSGNGSPSVLWINDGGARFQDASANLPATAAATNRLAFGDVDGDGDQDLVLANTGQNQLWINAGGGVFRDQSFFLPRDSDASMDLVLADVDGDRDLDIVFANGDDYNGRRQLNTLYLNNGFGFFTTSSQLTSTTEISLGVAKGDVDNDGDVDLYFANTGGWPYVPAPDALYLNDGAGRFTRAAQSSLPPADYTRDAVLGDLDGNGTLDLVRMTLVTTTIALGDGKGKFVVALGRGQTASANSATLADVDGDGDLDLFCGGWLSINRHRQAFATSLARAGGAWSLEIWAEPGYAPGPVPALPMIALGGLDPGLPIPPFGLLRIDPNSLLLLPPVSIASVHSVSLPIPNHASMLGRTLFAQSLVFHGSGSQTARLTNRFADLVFR